MADDTKPADAPALPKGDAASSDAPVGQATAPETAQPALSDNVASKEVEMTDAQDAGTEPEKVDENTAADERTSTQHKEDITESAEPSTTAQQETTEDGATNGDMEPAGADSKGKTLSRRKSGGVPEHKKKLNKKQSKANLTHTDAKPGDHFFARLKGFPPWPVIICDEEMLPSELIKTRPVSAAREDGTYRDENADGGPRVKDRSFAIMYLYTNEFGWIKNTDLHDLDFETVGTVKSSTRKDLQAAHQLASERHDLDYYKDVLKTFMEHKEADMLAKQEAAEAKEAKAEEARQAKAAKESKPKEKVAKSKKAANDDDDNDVDMADVDGDSEGASSGSKKRKAEDDSNAPPNDTKKVKLALKFKAPGTPNGTSTPKAKKETPAAKSSKPKQKKEKATPKTPAADSAPKEPEMTAEERRAKKEKEILFLRHKLQKGLLTKDVPPKEEDMKGMSEFISKLEGYADLEVSIIRLTKINKVLKAIIKLSSIPKEGEYKFKSRSQTLLDKWNKLLASDQATPTAVTNGTSEHKIGEEEKSTVTSAVTNGDETKSEAAKNDVKEDFAAKTEATAAETKGPDNATEQPKDVNEETEAPSTASKTAETAA